MTTPVAMSRPARRQVAKQNVPGPRPSAAAREGETGAKYNIYYDKWTGGGRTGGSSGKEKAPHRCDPAKDSGRTKGTSNPNAYFCVFFAKGSCPNGEDCNWLHRIPSKQDHVETGMDVFGRERFDEHRDDLGGVGSMRSNTKTLYVGRIQPSPNMRTIVEKHFKAWGDIELVKALNDKGIAFVTYQSRLNAEFAKEAMANQSLDHNEILNIRWATEDPNPKVQAMNKRKAIEMAQQAVEAKLPTDFKEAQHLPGSEELEESRLQKRAKQQAAGSESTSGSSEGSTPTLYLGADGQYYYDYGDYGYNHETQQYDPARLGGYNVATTKSQSAPSLQDRIKASLLSTATIPPSTSSYKLTDAKKPEPKPEPKPAISALSTLAAYDSDSESDGGEQ
ncbi:Pre-mRNA-splicing factor [Mortierella sp. NVP85]|nr:Pre-mRNA-splicing factor [Mortierella sp. NVP85]